MKRFLQLSVPGAALAAGLWINMLPVSATPDYAKSEKKACTFCHPAGKMKELTDAGKYYKDNNHSLKGYEPKADDKGKK